MMGTTTGDFKNKIKECVFSLTEKEGGITKKQIIAKVKARFSDEITMYGIVLADKGLQKVVSEILKKSEDCQEGTCQLRIAGTETPQSFCYTDEEDQKVWISTLNATQEMMLSHNEILKKNIKGATIKQRDWEAKLDYLEPAFIQNEGCTVGDAIKFLDSKAA